MLQILYLLFYSTKEHKQLVTNVIKKKWWQISFMTLFMTNNWRHMYNSSVKTTDDLPLPQRISDNYCHINHPSCLTILGDFEFIEHLVLGWLHQFQIFYNLLGGPLWRTHGNNQTFWQITTFWYRIWKLNLI